MIIYKSRYTCMDKPIAIENSIRTLSAEIVRLIKLPYNSWKNQDKIRSLDKQIEYLEELLAAFERDLKRNG